eukprot:2100692-Rhodomonas_salina.3
MLPRPAGERRVGCKRFAEDASAAGGRGATRIHPRRDAKVATGHWGIKGDVGHRGREFGAGAQDLDGLYMKV